MFLNRHYLNELAYEIYKKTGYRDNLGNWINRLKGTKKGVYFLAGMFVIDNELVPLVKIGQTNDVTKRKHQIYGSNPSTLYLIYFHKAFDEKERKEIEKDYHNKFNKYRVKREWFHLKPVVEELGLDWKRMNEEQ